MHIKTVIDNAYYISTNSIGDWYETMAFRVKRRKVDWSGIDTERATSRAVAIHHHLKLVAKYSKGRTV